MDKTLARGEKLSLLKTAMVAIDTLRDNEANNGDERGVFERKLEHTYAALESAEEWMPEDEEELPTTHDFNDGCGPVPAHVHSNGGGWVADTATVSESAFVGPEAKVYGRAVVTGDAKVSGDAWVSGYAVVSGDAEVSGNAWVSGYAVVSGYAMVSGYAVVSGRAMVSGRAVVSGAINISAGVVTSS